MGCQRYKSGEKNHENHQNQVRLASDLAVIPWHARGITINMTPWSEGPRMFRSGEFVAEHVTPVDAVQVQPNGVDLTLDRVFMQQSTGRLSQSGKTIGERTEYGFETQGPRDLYALDEGGYILRYAETVQIPEDHIGFILPRSSLMRNSCMLNTAVWDAGYEGRGEGLLQVHHPIELERRARVAQLVIAAADHSGTYDGAYQGENLSRFVTTESE